MIEQPHHKRGGTSGEALVRQEPREKPVNEVDRAALDVDVKILSLCRRELIQRGDRLRAGEHGDANDLKQLGEAGEQTSARVKFGRRALGDEANLAPLDVGAEERSNAVGRSGASGANQ